MASTKMEWLQNAKGFVRNLQPSGVGVVVLWGAVVVSALGVVYSTHQSRQLIHQLETVKRQAGELQVAWGQYLLEQSTWAAYSRIERVAVDKLDMQVPDNEDIVLVK